MMSKLLPTRQLYVPGHNYSCTLDTQLINIRGVGNFVILPNQDDQLPTNETSLEISVSIHETPRSVTFALPNGLLDNHPNIEGDGDFEYIQGEQVKDTPFNMRVKGNGTLTIEAVRDLGSHYFKIQLRIRSDAFVLLALPQELNGNFDIRGDGNIHFTTHFEDELSGDIDLSPTELLIATTETDGKAWMDASEKARSHGHKRNGSDYLQITGSIECMPCDSDTQDDDGSYETDDEEKSERLCEDQSDSDDNVEPGDVLETVSKSIDIYQDRQRRICYGGCQCEVLNGMSPKERKRDYEHTKGYDDFRNSVIRSNSGRDPWHKGACLKCAIRYYFTFLLHKLILPELCDHLYAKGIININYYSDLVELCNQNRVLEAKRSVLVHLSTRTVCHDDFLQVLYDSSLYKLVPYFYPGVNI